MGTTPAERAAQWRRFEDWEARRLHDAPPDWEETLAWFEAARDLARRECPDWAGGLDLEHVRRIGSVRAALARMAARA